MGWSKRGPVVFQCVKGSRSKRRGPIFFFQRGNQIFLEGGAVISRPGRGDQNFFAGDRPGPDFLGWSKGETIFFQWVKGPRSKRREPIFFFQRGNQNFLERGGCCFQTGEEGPELNNLQGQGKCNFFFFFLTKKSVSPGL